MLTVASKEEITTNIEKAYHEQGHSEISRK